MSGLREKCAVVGVSVRKNNNSAAQIACQALFALQHRGVEGSGIVATDGGALNTVRKPGMVRDVFHAQELAFLEGKIAIGHNRYSTSGDRFAHLQPVISDQIGYAFAHNGNIPDTTHLDRYLQTRRYITEQYNDSELMANVLASKLHGGREFADAIRETTEITTGAYACVATYGGVLAGFRDPHGIRPLELGEFDGGLMLASETCALDTVGARHIRSINPGEMIIIENDKVIYSEQFAEPNPHLDAFELVYFARHDSIMNGQRIAMVRRRFGEELASMHANKLPSVKNMVVTAVPDTSMIAAEAYAEAVGASYKSVIIKNRYIGRTFMQPTQAARQGSLRLKHTMIPELVTGKDLVMIDDSIVRGNTLPRLISLARELKAKSVSVLIASPPVRYPDFYGVDTPTQDELMASKMTTEEMRKSLGADYLGFLPVSSLVRATGIDREALNLSAFNGDYPVSIGKQAANIHPPVSTEYID